MPKPYPKEFRDDVVAVARQGQAPLTQIAKDFGISETCLSNWMKKADIEDGNRPGLTVKEAEQVRALFDIYLKTLKTTNVYRSTNFQFSTNAPILPNPCWR